MELMEPRQDHYIGQTDVATKLGKTVKNNYEFDVLLLDSRIIGGLEGA